MLLLWFLKNKNTLSRKHTVNLCLVNLFIKAMIINQELSVAVSSELQGLGHVCRISRLLQTNLRVVPREPGRLLSPCDYCQAMLCPPQCLCWVQSCYSPGLTLWCLKKNPSPKTDIFCYGRIFVKCSGSSDVASGVVMTSGRKNIWVWTCASTHVHFGTTISVFQAEGKAVTSQLSKCLVGPFPLFIVTALAAWPCHKAAAC